MNAKDLIKQVTTVEGTDLYSLRSIVKVAQQHGGNFNYKSVRARLSNTTALNKIGNDYGVEPKNLCHVFTYALPDFPKLMGLDATKVINQVKFINGSDLISLRSIVEAIKPYATKANYYHALEVLKPYDCVMRGGEAGVKQSKLSEGFAAAVSLDNYFAYLSLINKADEVAKDQDYFVRLYAAKAEKDAKEIQKAVASQMTYLSAQGTFKHAEYADGVKNSKNPFACRVQFSDFVNELTKINPALTPEKARKAIRANDLCWLYTPCTVDATVHSGALFLIASVLLRDTDSFKCDVQSKAAVLTDTFNMSTYCTHPIKALDCHEAVALFDGIVELLESGVHSDKLSHAEIFATIEARLAVYAAAA